MKPTRLTLTNWTAYEHAEIDFPEGIWMLWGATGSGKSTLLDAITFALYGETPRLGQRGRQNLIRHGKDAAQVVLEFEVGAVAYRIERAISKKGQECWLGRNTPSNEWEPLADKVKEVNAEIQRVLGISYDAFTRAVLLPQGRSAEILTGDPAQRRQVLTELLRLDRYRDVGRAANAREASMRAEIGVIEQGIAAAGGLTERLDAAETQLSLARAQRIEEDRRVRLAEEWLPKLREAEQACQSWPTGWGEAALARAQAYRQSAQRGQEEAERLRKARDTAEDLLATLRGNLEALELPEPVDGDLLVQLDQWLSYLRLVPEQEQRVADVKEVVRALTGRREHLRERLAHAQQMHAAFVVAKDLAEGDACPVCGGEFHGFVAAEDEGNLVIERTERDLQEVEAELGNEQRLLGGPETRLNDMRTGRDTLRLQLTKATWPDTVPVLDDPVDVEAQLGRLRQQQATYEENSEAQRAMERRIAEVVREHSGYVERLAKLQEQQVEKPTFPAAVLAKAEETGLIQEGEKPDAGNPDHVRLILASFQDRAREAERFLERSIAAADDETLFYEGVSVVDDVDRIREVAGAKREEHAAQQGRLEERIAGLTRQREEVREQEAKLETLRADAEVYGSIARHMHANRFIAFLQAETLDDTVAAAGEMLQLLSRGRYDLLLVDDESIEVRDQWLGDATRPVATLSGGELFMASLAMALALADETVKQASGGQRLEWVAVDEGFGTLDEETLEVVGSALAQLKAAGRSVGLISHVEALKDAVETVVNVVPGAAGSTLEVA